MIREYLVPGWLMVVQTFVTIAFILTFFALGVMSLELIRWPLKTVLQYEWLFTRVAFICCAVSSESAVAFMIGICLNACFCLRVQVSACSSASACSAAMPTARTG